MLEPSRQVISSWEYDEGTAFMISSRYTAVKYCTNGESVYTTAHRFWELSFKTLRFTQISSSFYGLNFVNQTTCFMQWIWWTVIR